MGGHKLPAAEGKGAGPLCPDGAALNSDVNFYFAGWNYVLEND